jgi:steroid 5-alpha reductase family enzyme
VTSFDTGGFLASLPFTLLAVVVVLWLTLLVALRAGRHAVVDVAWGLGFAAVAVTSFALSAAGGAGARRWLVAALTVVWGVRLAVHLGLRSRGRGEDPRYEAMLAEAPGNPTRYAVRRIYLTQGAVMWFVSLPVQVAVFAPGGAPAVMVLGVVIWLVGFVFETVGDLQLTRFRNDPSSAGQVLDTGLWRYTRHPNYFGDLCVWWGIFLVAAGHPLALVTVVGPLLMSYLLISVTGKELTEKSMSQRPGYDEYVRRTSGFLPLPPGSSAARAT